MDGGGQFGCARGSGAVRDLAQTHIGGDHAAGGHSAHLVPADARAVQRLLQALAHCLFQAVVVAVDGTHPHAGLAFCLSQQRAVLQYRHPGVGGAGVDGEIDSVHSAPSFPVSWLV